MSLITRCVGSQRFQGVTITTNAGQAHGGLQSFMFFVYRILNHPKEE